MKLTKIVNIYPSMPITGVNPPIRSVVRRVTKSIDEIRACLMARATVEEILSNGTTVKLNIGNYDKCLDDSGKSVCDCGNNCNCGWKVVDTSDNATESKVEDNATIKSDWQTAYNNALAGKDLANMSRKQRRSAEAAARAAADAIVASETSEVVIDSTETVEEKVVETETTVEETVVAEPVVESVEEVVETNDVETTPVSE